MPTEYCRPYSHLPACACLLRTVPLWLRCLLPAAPYPAPSMQLFWAREGPYQPASAQQISEAFYRSPTGQAALGALEAPFPPAAQPGTLSKQRWVAGLAGRSAGGRRCF